MIHQPWCADHREQVCLSETIDDVTITWAPGEPVTVWVDGPDGVTEIPLTVGSAQKAARAILRWFPDA